MDEQIYQLKEKQCRAQLEIIEAQSDLINKQREVIALLTDSISRYQNAIDILEGIFAKLGIVTDHSSVH